MAIPHGTSKKTATGNDAESGGEFRVTVLDIPDVGRGVGLAVVLRTPGGGTVLYDTGVGYPENDGWVTNVNSGRDQILPFLQRHGIGAIDTLIVSHAHYDHFGGLLWLADHVPIRELIDNGYEFHGDIDDHYSRELAHYTHVRERLRGQGVSYRAVHAGDILDLDSELVIRVIAPPENFFHEAHPEDRPVNDPAAHYLLNANSVMLHIRHREVEFLFPGDIEKDDQSECLLPSLSAAALRCDIMIAPGHGLHSAPDFAAATHPKVVIASCFARWMTSCTAREVFKEYGAEVYVTGMHGNVDVVSDGHSWQVRASGVQNAESSGPR